MATKKPEIRNWFLRTNGAKCWVEGAIYGHAIKADGKIVQTNAITKVEGCEITTASGSVYILLEPSSWYLTFCSSNGVAFDPLRPVILSAQM